jgi:hypothetical protein
VLVSGGYGLIRNVIGESEIFNVNDNYWTVISSMNTKRASHSLLSTENGRSVYAFGGVDANGMALDTIERFRFTHAENPLADTNVSWELINVVLPQPIINIGCAQLSLKEILVFGGFTAEGDTLATGRVMMIENEDKGVHLLLQDPINLETADAFSNPASIKKQDDNIYIMGNLYVHLLSGRKFSTYLPLM